MMRWWLDRGVDGFRMDVINMISKDVGPGRPPARRPAAARLGARRRHRRTSSAGRGSTSSSPRCTARSSPGATDSLLTVGEMPGVTVEEAVLFTDPRAGRGGHGVPVRARRPRPRDVEVGRPAAADARPQGLVRALAGGAGRGRLELPLLGQPRPAARRLPLRRRQPRVPPRLRDLPGHAAAPAPGDAVRLPGPGDRDGQLSRSRPWTTSPTSSRSTTTCTRSRPARTRRTCWPRCAR